MSGRAFGAVRDNFVRDNAMKWARAHGSVSGGLAARAVLLLMADYADRQHQLFPSIATMAAELDCAERTVQRAIGSLESDGLIERTLRLTATGKSTSSRYGLRVDDFEAGRLGRATFGPPTRGVRLAG